MKSDGYSALNAGLTAGAKTASMGFDTRSMPDGYTSSSAAEGAATEARDLNLGDV